MASSKGSNSPPVKAMFVGANRRGGALLLDLVVVFALMLVAKIAVETAFDRAPAWLTYAVCVAYFVALPPTPWQGTLAKRGIGIKITDLAGNRIGVGRALLRFAASLVSFAALGLGYALCFWNARRRTLHDFVAGTVVVDAKATAAEIASASPQPMAPSLRAIKTLVFLLCFWVPFWFFWVGMNARTAYEANAVNLAEAKRVVTALEDYKRKHGRFPLDLAALFPAHLASDLKLQGNTTLYYLSTPPGDGCRLAIVYWLRPGFFPSDDGNEYDCATATWEVRDLSELQAKREHGLVRKGAP